MLLMPGFKRGPHWWDTSALTFALGSLLPQITSQDPYLVTELHFIIWLNPQVGKMK